MPSHNKKFSVPTTRSQFIHENTIGHSESTPAEVGLRVGLKGTWNGEVELQLEIGEEELGHIRAKVRVRVRAKIMSFLSCSKFPLLLPHSSCSYSAALHPYHYTLPMKTCIAPHNTFYIPLYYGLSSHLNNSAHKSAINPPMAESFFQNHHVHTKDLRP